MKITNEKTKEKEYEELYDEEMVEKDEDGIDIITNTKNSSS